MTDLTDQQWASMLDTFPKNLEGDWIQEAICKLLAKKSSYESLDHIRNAIKLTATRCGSHARRHQKHVEHHVKMRGDLGSYHVSTEMFMDAQRVYHFCVQQGYEFVLTDLVIQEMTWREIGDKYQRPYVSMWKEFKDFCKHEVVKHFPDLSSDRVRYPVC
jgi:hypothetical protein